MQIRMRQPVFAALTRSFQMVDQIRLGQPDDAWIRASVQVPKVPAGIWLASEGTFLTQAPHEDRSYIFEE